MKELSLDMLEAEDNNVAVRTKLVFMYYKELRTQMKEYFGAAPDWGRLLPLAVELAKTHEL